MNDSMDDTNNAKHFDDVSEMSADENELINDTDFKVDEQKPKYKRRRSKKKRNEFEKTFNEYRHLFAMSCDICSKEFESYDDARMHNPKEHNATTIFMKSKTGYRLYSRTDVLRYIDVHLNPDKLKYVLCQHNCYYVSFFLYEFGKLINIFRCMECNRRLSGHRELNSHLKTHEKSSIRYECDICKKKFTKSDSLRSHKKQHEKNPENEIHQKFMADHFDMTCDLCDAKFTAFFEARHHYEDVHGCKKHYGYLKCCGQKMSTPGQVSDHINIHLRSTTFQ